MHGVTLVRSIVKINAILAEEPEQLMHNIIMQVVYYPCLPCI